MKKKIIFATALSCLLVMSACSKKTADKTDGTNSPATSEKAKSSDSTSSKSSSTSSSSKKEVTSESSAAASAKSTAQSSAAKTPVADTKASTPAKTTPAPKPAPVLWSPEKAATLKAYMAGFSATDNRQYERYTPEVTGKMYGTTFPTDVLNGQKKMVVGGDGDPASTFAWSENGTSQADYSMVDCYSNLATGMWMDQYTYIFVIQKGQPHVFVTTQNEWHPDNALHFFDPENPDIQANFAKIVAE